jgi:hypothetical protein
MTLYRKIALLNSRLYIIKKHSQKESNIITINHVILWTCIAWVFFFFANPQNSYKILNKLRLNNRYERLVLQIKIIRLLNSSKRMNVCCFLLFKLGELWYSF